MLTKKSSAELHLQSTVGELKLFDSQIDIDDKMAKARQMFESDLSIPGIIVKHRNGLTFLTRKTFYESLSRPFALELFSSKRLRDFIENMEISKPIILNSSMQIVQAVPKYLENLKDVLDDSIIVEFENGTLKVLDSYQLILAHSHINNLAMQKLKEANELKSEMLSIAAHDLKNPLYAIIGLAKIMRQDLSQCPGKCLDSLAQIEDISQHMFNLIMELLNSNVIESGKLQLNKQVFDLDELVSAIIYQNQSQLEKKNQSIKYLVNRDIEFIVDGDAVKLREAMENLVSNAIKYSPFGSVITLSLEIKDNTIRFAVKDKGPGLTDDDKEKLFGKFQRLSAQPTNGESSTGLGLFIARQIVELHGGKIGVESICGEGSTFFIDLEAVDL